MFPWNWRRQMVCVLRCIPNCVNTSFVHTRKYANCMECCSMIRHGNLSTLKLKHRIKSSNKIIEGYNEFAPKNVVLKLLEFSTYEVWPYSQSLEIFVKGNGNCTTQSNGIGQHHYVCEFEPSIQEWKLKEILNSLKCISIEHEIFKVHNFYFLRLLTQNHWRPKTYCKLLMTMCDARSPYSSENVDSTKRSLHVH